MHVSNDNVSPYLTADEAAAYLRFASGSSIRTLVQRGEIAPIGRGARGCLLFTREQLDALVMRRQELSSGQRARQRRNGTDDAAHDDEAPGHHPAWTGSVRDPG